MIHGQLFDRGTVHLERLRRANCGPYGAEWEEATVSDGCFAASHCAARVTVRDDAGTNVLNPGQHSSLINTTCDAAAGSADPASHSPLLPQPHPA